MQMVKTVMAYKFDPFSSMRKYWNNKASLMRVVESG